MSRSISGLMSTVARVTGSAMVAVPVAQAAGPVRQQITSSSAREMLPDAKPTRR